MIDDSNRSFMELVDQLYDEDYYRQRDEEEERKAMFNAPATM